MPLDGTPSQIPQNQLRRRRKTERVQSQCPSDLNTEEEVEVELSMHLPVQPFDKNRFEVFGRASPSFRRNGAHRPSTYQGRPRYCRGSREGKRRREARRNKRRLAAVEILDEQLSRDLDRTLRQANVQEPMPQRFPGPTSAAMTTPPPRSNLMNVAATDPRFPYLNFGGLDLMYQECPPTPRKRSPTSLSSPSLVSQLPRWSPAMPSFLNDNTKWNEWPLFFDLSKLLDPLERPKPSPRCQEMQLWQPQGSCLPKRQASFFPQMTPPRLNAKASSAADKLQDNDRSVQDAAVQTDATFPWTLLPRRPASDDIGSYGGDEKSGAYPANLWQILKTPQKGNLNDAFDPNVVSFAYQPVKNKYRATSLPFDHRFGTVGSPCELDNTEVPFVHGNSLTGHANERATYPVQASDDAALIFHSSVNLTSVQELPFGLNELMVDRYMEEGHADAMLGLLDLPPLPHSPTPESTTPVPNMGVPATCDYVDGGEEMRTCDAHYESEQALFQPRSPAIRPIHEDINDAATFLDISHTPHCLCKDCNEPPEIVSDNMIDQEEWMDFLALTRSRSPSISSTWEAGWGMFLGADEVEDGTWAAQWDDFLSCTPSSLAHGPW